MGSNKFCLAYSWSYDHVNNGEVFFCIEDCDVMLTPQDDFKSPEHEERLKAKALELAEDFFKNSLLVPKHGGSQMIALYRVVSGVIMPMTSYTEQDTSGKKVDSTVTYKMEKIHSYE